MGQGIWNRKRKKTVYRLLALALVLGMLSGSFQMADARETGRASTNAEPAITLEITLKNAEPVETSGSSLTDALQNARAPYRDVIIIHILSGTITTEDWKALSAAEKKSDPFPNLCELTAEEGVRSQMCPAGWGLPHSLEIVEVPAGTLFLAASMFAGCRKLKSVKIPDTVASIGSSAFENCSSLTSVVIPEGVKAISSGTFSGCSSLTDITIPDSVKKIERNAFENCSSLTEITLPEEMESIGVYAFQFCSSLQKIVIPGRVETISQSAFEECRNLAEVTIPDTVTTIEDRAFYYCDSLTRVTIPDSVTTIGNLAFYHCDSLTGVTLPRFLTTMKGQVFSQCRNLTNVKMLGREMKIGSGVFYWCNKLSELTIQNGVELDQELYKPSSEILSKDPHAGATFYGCGLDTLNIVMNVSDATEPVKPAQVMQQELFDNGVANERALYFYANDGVTPLSDRTKPTLDQVVSVYLAAEDGDTEDNYWYGWEIGQMYSVENQLTNVTTDNDSTVWRTSDGDYKAVLSPASSGTEVYELPETIRVTIGGSEVLPGEDYTYDPLSGHLVIRQGAIDGGIVITAVTNNLFPREVKVKIRGDGAASLKTEAGSISGMKGSVIETTVRDGKSAVLTLKPDEGCQLLSLIVAGEKKEVEGDTYTLSDIRTDLEIEVVFSEKEPDPGPSPTILPGADPTPAPSPTGSADPTPVPSPTSSACPVVSESPTPTVPALPSPTLRPVSSPSVIPVPTVCPTGSPIPTVSPTPTASASPAPTESQSPTASPSPAPTESQSPTASPSPAPAESQSPTVSPSPTLAATVSPAVPSIQPSPTFAVLLPKPTMLPKPTVKPVLRPIATKRPVITFPPALSPSPTPNGDLADISAGLGVPPETAVKIQEMAKGLDVSKDTILITENTIASQKTDDDLKGSYFARIRARAAQVTENNIKLVWNRVKAADGYQVYGNRCNTRKRIYEYKRLKTIGKGTKKSYIARKCRKGTYYKYIVRAYKIIDGKKVTIAASKTIHAVTAGGKYGNAGNLKMNRKKVSLAVAQKKKIKAKEIKKDKKLRHHREVRFESGDRKTASVSRKGVIRGRAKGKCTVYVYAQNGLFRKIKVKVK